MSAQGYLMDKSFIGGNPCRFSDTETAWRQERFLASPHLYTGHPDHKSPAQKDARS